MTTIISDLKNIFPVSCHDRIFIVGGSVRDLMLGNNNRDIDLVAALSDEELRNLGFRFVETASASPIYFMYSTEFGTIEITRINSVDDLKSDLHRRDFTINAMAMTLDSSFIDPLNGTEALKHRHLVACSDATFTGDPLRVMRAFRFEADGWCMTPETAALIRQQEWSAPFSTIPVERFSREMLKALACRSPERFFQLMLDFRAGEEFLPELFRMPHIPAGPVEHHPERDLFTHSTQVLQRVAAESGDPLTRFCAFFHDLGKLATDPALYPKHHGHDHTGFAMAVDFCNRLRLSAVHRTALAWISSLHGTANLWESLRDSTKITMAERAVKAGIVDILPLVAAADKCGGKPMAGWNDTVLVARMNMSELGIDPEKLEGMPVKNRPAFILQKRLEILRKTITPKKSILNTEQQSN